MTTTASTTDTTRRERGLRFVLFFEQNGREGFKLKSQPHQSHLNCCTRGPLETDRFQNTEAGCELDLWRTLTHCDARGVEEENYKEEQGERRVVCVLERMPKRKEREREEED